MEMKELNRILSTKAPAGERLLIELPQNISCQHSSATDYLDAVVSYGSQMMKSVDNLMVRFRLGAVHKKLSGCRGAIMPRINYQGKIMDGSVLYFDVQSGKILYEETLADNLYNWYGFDYYTDKEVFFGEHLISNKPVAIVQEEMTALLGSLAEPSVDWLAIGVGRNLTVGMLEKLKGKRMVLFPDDMNCESWKDYYGGMVKVDENFAHRDINQYLVEKIKSRGSPKNGGDE